MKFIEATCPRTKIKIVRLLSVYSLERHGGIMMCNKCKKKEAKIYCTEIINGEKKEQYLCEECAAEYASFKIESAGINMESGLGSLLSSILGGYYQEREPQDKTEAEEIKCPGCNLTYSEFLSEGKFGCGNCYRSFDRMLEKSIKQIQGTERHTGKRPVGYVSPMEQVMNGLTDVEKMTMKLHEAVEKEEYEEAARLRDLIKAAKEDKEEIPHA